MAYLKYSTINCDLCGREQTTNKKENKRPRYQLIFPDNSRLILDLCSYCEPESLLKGWKNCLNKIISWTKLMSIKQNKPRLPNETQNGN